MSIQWFPGHMAKARREVLSSLKLVDVVIEILDARLPDSSRNPMMREVLKEKPTVVALGKVDLADEQVTAQYVKAWSGSESVRVVTVDNVRGVGLPQVIQSAKALAQIKLERLRKKGIRREVVRAMVVGIPNVGKSSFINRMAGKSVAKTGDKPGVTKQQQWIKVGGAFELLDTPGILWPKFDDHDTALHLAWSGAIKSTILQNEDLALELVLWLQRHYPERLIDRYGIHEDFSTSSEALEKIALRRGALKPGGIPDITQAADFLLRDVQTGLLGRLTFDRPS